MGLIPVGDSEFFFVHARVIVKQLIFIIYHRA